MSGANSLRANGAPLPEEDASVPGDAWLLREPDGSLALRLLLEAEQRVCGQAVGFGPREIRDQVAVLGRRPGRPDPKRHERLRDPEGRVRQLGRGIAQGDAELRLVAHLVVCRQDDHDSILGRGEGDRGHRDRGRGVPSLRLLEDGHAESLGTNERRIAPTHDHRHAAIRDVPHPVDGTLEERPVPEEREERLRAICRGERPEARASAARQDHRVHRPILRAWRTSVQTPSMPDRATVDVPVGVRFTGVPPASRHRPSSRADAARTGSC